MATGRLPSRLAKWYGSCRANRTNFNENYHELVGSLKLLRAKDFIIDGEIAALDQNGRSSFQLLQSYGIRKGIPLVYYAFDLLSLDGSDLRSRPLAERRKLLATLLKKSQMLFVNRTGAIGTPLFVGGSRDVPRSSSLSLPATPDRLEIGFVQP